MNFQTFFKGACPQTFWSLFFCSSTCFKLILPEKLQNLRLKKCRNSVLSLLKEISDYASDMKHFQRAYLRPFPRLDVYRFCIYVRKHSTYFKIASPHQNCLDFPRPDVKVKLRDNECKHTSFRSFSIGGPLQLSITHD